MDHYGITVSAFADQIGVQRSSISHLLNGRNRPSLDFVMKLIEAYPEVDLYWLLKEEGVFPHTPQRLEEAAPEIKPPQGKERAKRQDPLPVAPEKDRQGGPTDLVNIVVFYGDGTFRSFDQKKD